MSQSYMDAAFDQMTAYAVVGACALVGGAMAYMVTEGYKAFKNRNAPPDSWSEPAAEAGFEYMAGGLKMGQDIEWQ